jgi:hypothetical protein
MYRKLWFVGLLSLWAVGSAIAAFDPLTDPSLIAWWRCEEGQGNVVGDSSPNHHDGTFVNGAPAWTTGFRGEGSGIRLVGPTLVEIPALNLTLTHATMAGWVLPNGTQSDWASIIMHRGNGLAHGFNLLGDRRLAYHWNDDSASWSYRGTAYYAADEWTHCAVTIEPTKATFYVNGVAASTNAITHTAATWDNPVHLGGDDPASWSGRQMNGSLDDVLFMSRALTAAEIKSLVPPVFKATKPSPTDGALSLPTPLFSWKKGDTALFHDVYFGTSPELTEADKVGSRQPFALYYCMKVLEPGVTYYWRVDEIDGQGTIYTGDVWSVMMTPLQAYVPAPADGATDVSTLAALSWLAGQDAVGHQVYFSMNRDDVENGAAVADQGVVDTTAFDAGMLRASTTYYWRVDELKTGDKVEKGNVWSFTTGGQTNKALRQWWLGIAGTAVTDLTNNVDYPANPSGSELVDVFEGPVDWADYYGQRILGWLKPPEDGEYTFWISSDDGGALWLSTDADPTNTVAIASVSGWTGSRDFDNASGQGGANQKSAAISLQAGRKYFIQALQKEGGGGDNLAVAWQGPGINGRQVIEGRFVDTFALPPLQAFSPNPANGAVDVPQSPTLTWGAGERAQKHEVYLGQDQDAVAAADTTSPLFKGSLTSTSLAVANLDWNTTYYWRVDEVAAGDPESPWTNGVWSFTTANFLLVDDFESYNDVEGTDTRIYENWIDGYVDQSSGSIVGNFDPPFAERTIVHGGRQSMPMTYDNSVPPYFSEAYREFAPTQNWTVNGVDTLSLWVQGQQAEIAPVVETDGKMTVTGEGTDIWGTADQFTFVYKTLNGDGSLVARVTSNGTGSNRWAKGGAMIRDSLEAGSASAQMCLTGGDGNGGAFQNRASTDLDMNANDATSNTTVATAIAPPYWVKIERTGNTITGSISADGKTWTQVGISQYIAMQAPSYIGICVTSHAAGEYRTFEFDNIKATGASGAWETKEIGLTRNGVQDLYVVVEDSSSKKAMAVDPNAVNATTWYEVKIPLSDLAGVNLAKVKKLYIGVGDRDNPVADGTGKIYVDDIRVIKAPEEAPEE